jgi:hypothetical protein
VSRGERMAIGCEGLLVENHKSVSKFGKCYQGLLGGFFLDTK